MRHLAFVVLLAFGLATGCVSSADKALVSTGAAVGDGDIANWERLTDTQKKTACWKLTRAMHVLDYGINSKPLDPQWQTTIPPWGVAATSTASTARSAGK